MCKYSGIKDRYSGRPEAVRLTDTVTDIQIVFCLHAFNIPYYRDKYNPLCHQIVLAAGRQWISGSVGQWVRRVDDEFVGKRELSIVNEKREKREEGCRDAIYRVRNIKIINIGGYNNEKDVPSYH